MTGYAHGTGWAGIARYVARERIRARLGRRAGEITVLAARQEHRADLEPRTAERLAALRAEQDADLTLLDGLSIPSDGPLVRHRWQPRSTYNGEDDHVTGWEEKP